MKISLLLFLFCCSPLFAKETIQVIILCGQSNADGRAQSPKIPKSYKSKFANILLFHGNASGNSHLSCPGYQLISMRTGSASLKKGKNQFGPEIGLANKLEKTYPQDKFCIIKYAKGGSSLFSDWNLTNGIHLKKLRNTVNQGLNALKNAGYRPQIRALVWHQGESDANDKRAPQYKAKLTRFIKQLELDFSTTMHIALGQISSQQKLNKKSSLIVRQAQQELAESKEGYSLVKSEGLSLQKDKLHFDAAGQISLGEAYAEALIPHLKKRTILELWPEGVLDRSQRDSESSTRRGGVSRIRNVSVPTLTFYPANKKNAPSMVICPGGGYNILAIDKEGEEVAEWLNKRGFNTFILKYRLPLKNEVRHKKALKDAQRAISLIRSISTEFNLDKNKVGIMGFSAGGHLAAITSTTVKRTYQSVDHMDKESFKPDFCALVYPAYLTDKGQLKIDFKVDSETPITFLAHAQDDPINVKNSLIYAQALQDKNVLHSLNIYTNGGHGYGMRTQGKDSDKWPSAFENWLVQFSTNR